MSKKKLMNEVLPDPKPPAGTGPVRRRVVDHLRKVIGVGAATVSLGSCTTTPFGVVDPLPPPARCAKITDLISDLTATAMHAADGGQALTLTITAAAAESGDLRLLGVSAGGGGSIGVPQLPNALKLVVDVTPTAPMAVVVLDTSCRGTTESVRVTIDTTTLNVTLTMN
jgi:hypothetical protein